MRAEEYPDSSGEDPSGPSFSLDDAYYILFRRKWLILAFFCLGLAGAVAIWFVRPPRYESKALLMVKYVADVKLNPDGIEQFRSLDAGVDAAMQSEVQMIRSLDVAAEVADLIGPEKILAKQGGGNDRMSAAAAIRAGLEVDPPKSSVLTITFRHREKDLVELVLNKVIERYYIMHRRTHRPGGGEEKFFAEQRDTLRQKMTVTEGRLNQLLIEAKGMSPADAKTTYAEQIKALMQELFKTQTDLAEAKALLGDVPTGVTATVSTKLSSVPTDKLERYNLLSQELDKLRRQERNYLINDGFTLQHPSVTNVQGQIERATKQQATLETEFPGLTALRPLAAAQGGTNSMGVDLGIEMGRMTRLAARAEALMAQLASVQGEARKIIALEPEISRLQREREQDDKDYRYFLDSLSLARADSEGMKVSNMSIIQHPTPPGRDTKKVLKLIGIAFGGCAGMGLALAFLLEFLVDRTIKRGVEIERHLKLPLLISIPDAGWTSRPRFALPGRRHRSTRRSRREHAHEENGNGHGDSNGNGAVVRWDSRQSIQLYANGLRERLITYFEGAGPAHSKPKRVAVTSCSHGAGVTTVATSLASSLSRIPDVKVLLVDMNISHGVARTFRNGEPCVVEQETQTFEPPADVTESANENGQANGHANGHEGAVVPMRSNGNGHGFPSGLAHLAPQFEANNHDFIIFDLPPASQTSMTPRLAGYMDIVLLVLESEKTGRQLANHASKLMQNSRANVAAVLNKYRKYVPEKLSQEF